jgi:hypothetical protein
LGDSPTGIFHQSKASDTAGNGQPIGFSHFCIAKELDHSCTISEPPIARRQHNALLR